MSAKPPTGPAVRVPPAPLGSLGMRARLIARAAGLATRGEPPRVLTTLARHPRLFRRWLPFARTLLLRPELPRADVELLILRTAWNCGSWYEWVQHVPLAARAGLGHAAIDRVPDGPDGVGWTPRQVLLLRAADELHDRRVISDPTWAALAGELREKELIELCLVVGHYAMVAMALNSLGVEPEATALERLDEHAGAAAERLRRSLARAREPSPPAPAPPDEAPPSP